jgi:hypothetical protein
MEKNNGMHDVSVHIGSIKHCVLLEALIHWCMHVLDVFSPETHYERIPCDVSLSELNHLITQFLDRKSPFAQVQTDFTEVSLPFIVLQAVSTHRCSSYGRVIWSYQCNINSCLNINLISRHQLYGTLVQPVRF